MVVRKQAPTPKHFAKPNGFSLIELLIAAGLSFGVVLLSAVLIEGLLGQDRAIKGALAADAQMEQADYVIQRYFRTAVDTKWTATAIAAGQNLTTASHGLLINSFNSDPATGWPANNSITTLALFYRDNAAMAYPITNTVSSFMPTGVFYQQSTPTTYGVLYIDDGSYGNRLKPSLNNVVVDHIVALSIVAGSITPTTMPLGAGVPSYVRSFQLSLTVRSPIYSNNTGGAISWCGPNRMAADASCKSAAVGNIPYADSVRVLTITLYNNYDPTMVPSDGPALGRVYFAR